MSGFHFPFYGGGGPVDVGGEYGGEPVASEPLVLSVSLYGVEYAVELVPYRRRSLDRQVQSQSQTGQPDDSQYNKEGAWWRYVYSWHHGAGQQVQDFGPDFDPLRFYDSRGIDPWDEFGAKLLPSTELKQAATAGTVLLIATGGFVYMSDGLAVKRSADLVTWNSITGLGGTIQDLATDGSDAYIATSTEVFKVSDSGGVAATDITTDTDDYQKVAFVGNRLIVASDNVIYELLAGGARTVIKTHFQTAFRWTTVFNIGSRIYIGGFAGNRSELYTVTTDSAGALVASAEAAQFPYNELLRGGISYGGVAVLATSLGVRMGTLAGDGSLTYGPLIDAPGDVRAITAEGRFAWFGWDGFFGEGSGLGRLALDTTVAPLQPAYATDVMTAAAVADVTGVVRFANKTVFAVAGLGVYATTTNYVDSGWIESGQVYLGTIETKAVTSLSVRTDELATGQSVQTEVFDNEGDTVADFTVNGPGVFGDDITLDASQVTWVKIRITLDGTTTLTPQLRSWRLRGYPIVPTVEEWIVPLIMHQYVVVNDGMGQLQSQSSLEQVERLIAACKAGTVITYREGARSYRVRIDKYELQPREWVDTSEFFEGIFLVRLLSA